MKRKQAAAIAVVAAMVAASAGIAAARGCAAATAGDALSRSDMPGDAQVDMGGAASGAERVPLRESDVEGIEWLAGQFTADEVYDLVDALSWHITEVEGNPDPASLGLSVVRRVDRLADSSGETTQVTCYFKSSATGGYYQASARPGGLWDADALHGTVPGVNVSEDEYRASIPKDDGGGD